MPKCKPARAEFERWALKRDNRFSQWGTENEVQLFDERSDAELSRGLLERVVRVKVTVEEVPDGEG